jgi:hypothetical protein
MRPLALACLLALVAWASVARADDAPSPDDVRPLEAAGRFDEAAALLEQRATVPDVAPDVARAWLDRALNYRLALDDTEAATRILRALAAVAPVAHVAARALDLGDVLIRRHQWRESATFHTAWLARYGRRADATLRARANVALGNAWRELGDAARAAVAYRRVRVVRLPPPRASFSGGGALGIVSPYGGMTETDMTETANRAATFDARSLPASRAEAMFWQVEPRYQRFVGQALPVYSGPPTRRSYDRWVEAVLNPWFNASMSELYGPFTSAYTAVVNEHAPRWEIAALEHLATASMSHAALMSGVPPPPDIVHHPEMLDFWRYFRNPDPAWVPFIDIAMDGYRRCIVLSTHYRTTHSLSRCERALYDLDRVRFPLPDELTRAADHGAFAARDLPAAPPVPRP